MLYLTCTTITSIDLAHYRVSRAKDWVSVKCGTSNSILLKETLDLYLSLYQIIMDFAQARSKGTAVSSICLKHLCKISDGLLKKAVGGVPLNIFMR